MAIWFIPVELNVNENLKASLLLLFRNDSTTPIVRISVKPSHFSVSTAQGQFAAEAAMRLFMTWSSVPAVSSRAASFYG